MMSIPTVLICVTILLFFIFFLLFYYYGSKDIIELVTSNEDGGQQHEYESTQENSLQTYIGKYLPGAGGCQIDLNKLNNPPLPVNADNKIWYPNTPDRKLWLQDGESRKLHCPECIYTVLCHNGNTIYTRGETEVNFADLPCKKKFKTFVESTEEPCGVNGKKLIAGFETSLGDLIGTYYTCFNFHQHIALYTEKYQSMITNQSVTGKRTESFKKGSGIYKFSVEKCYTIEYQKAHLNRLLGLPEKSTKYIDNEKYYLQRGHLSARAENFYEAEKNASFLYINCAPQWCTFNQGNWKIVERNIRKYGEDKEVRLKVWTICYGVATLSHEITGEPTELYLYIDEITQEKKLPVPAIFVKVVYNPMTTKGIAIIGVNNHYKSSSNYPEIPEEDDVLSEISWLNFKSAKDAIKGYCYGVKISSFKRLFPDILGDDFIDGGLLE